MIFSYYSLLGQNRSSLQTKTQNKAYRQISHKIQGDLREQSIGRKYIEKGLGKINSQRLALKDVIGTYNCKAGVTNCREYLYIFLLKCKITLASIPETVVPELSIFIHVFSADNVLG